MIKAIIIDDEIHCIDTLSILLADYCPEVTVLEKCNSAKRALDAIERHQPELVFLDIEMPVMNGFELLGQFKQIPFSVVFTTSYDQYAIKAIRFSALDYLLKPIDPKELIAAVHKVQVQKAPPSADQFKLLLEQIQQKDNDIARIAAMLDKKNFFANQPLSSSQQRRLAAILFTDIVGYTSIMQQNENAAINMIKRHMEVLNKYVTPHSGEILNDYGDGSLCIFPSAAEAVHAALEIQQQLHDEPAIPLRIGLHIGEIFFENGKIFGDGVNVASRIQSLGAANTILFSEEIQDKIKNNPLFKFVSLGSFDFKNVEKPIKVFALTNEGCRIPSKEEMNGKTKKTNWVKSFFGIK
jgi:class 3 adenylate cyclase